jgi:hypothetical protein
MRRDHAAPFTGPARTFGDVFDVAGATTVIIHDVWTGAPGTPPIAGVYQLCRREDGGMTGKGRLVLAATGAEIDVVVSARLTRAFLDALAVSPIDEEPYEPRRAKANDDPRIQIAIHTGVRDAGSTGGVAVAFTESQGDAPSPWAVFVDGLIYRSNSTDIARALRGLDRALGRTKLERPEPRTTTRSGDARGRRARP